MNGEETVNHISTSSEDLYSTDWQLELCRKSLRSARIIVPLITSMVKPDSVIDIGCGLGAWLSVFREFGIKDVLGIDGEYIDEQKLLIPKLQFLSADLTMPLPVSRQYEVVLSLEVAEHLEEKYASAFVKNLSALGPVVVFSAAIPFQGGTHHVNEQWPDYWIQKFESLDYIFCDAIREKIWDNLEVDFWYAQNILLFIRKTALAKYPALVNSCRLNRRYLSAIVHPINYLGHVKRERELETAYEALKAATKNRRDPQTLSPVELYKLLGGALTTSVKQRLKKFIGT